MITILNKELVSVCIPTYNSGKFIKRTIDSVLKQSYDNFEIIISDDCSKDDTIEVIKKYDDPRIKLFINEQNKGLSQNWNESISHSKGEFIKLLCADDILYKTCLEKEVFALEMNPSASMVISDLNILNTEGKIKLKVKRFNKSKLIDGKKLAKRSILIKNYYGAPCNTTFRSEVINKIGLFDEKLKYIPDFDLWLRLSYVGDVYYINKTLSAFRIHSSSNTSELVKKDQEKYCNDHLKLIKKHKELNYIKINDIDITIHKIVRNTRNFMLLIFLKYFVKR